MASTTVIIPTLLKSQGTLDYNIKLLLEQNVKIILIDNSPSNGCKKYEHLGVQIFYFPDNIGVNPAWNIGIQNTETKYYLLLNDDCLIWNKVIEHSEEILKDPTIGLLTYKTVESMELNLYKTLSHNKIGNPELINLGPHYKVQRIGWFMYGKTKDYEEIPGDLKIFYGDDLLYKIIRKKGLRTVQDTSKIISHFTSSTVNTIKIINDIAREEQKFYNKLIETKNLVSI